jgi:hypothetical protein
MIFTRDLVQMTAVGRDVAAGGKPGETGDMDSVCSPLSPYRMSGSSIEAETCTDPDPFMGKAVLGVAGTAPATFPINHDCKISISSREVMTNRYLLEPNLVYRHLL